MSEAEELFVRWLALRPEASEGDLEELCRVHPAHAAELRAFHDKFRCVSRWLEGAGLGLGREHGHSFGSSTWKQA